MVFAMGQLQLTKKTNIQYMINVKEKLKLLCNNTL